MKHTFTLSLVFASLLVTTPVFAADQWLDPETEGAISHDMEQTGYVGTSYIGTSLSDTRSRIHVFGEPNSAFPNPDVDESGFVIGTSGPEKGEGDLYGSVLYDVGVMQ